MLPVEKRINYQIFGQDSSPKLVFLHGIMGRGRNWASIAKKFAKDFQCLVYDQRGHGQSEHPQSFDLADFSQDLQDLLQYLAWDQPVCLVGHSMGGRVALQFAHLYPQRLQKLVILDVSPAASWESMTAILERLQFVPTPFNSRDEARSFMENQFLAKFPNKVVKDFFYSNLVGQQGQFDWAFSKVMVRQVLQNSRYKDYWAEFKSLQMPTLYIRGADSQDLKEVDFTQVLQNNPMIQGQTVAGAGHWVHAEKPRQTLQIMADFFAGSKPAG